MLIAITGATGFIGKRFMELAAEGGHRFVVLARRDPKAPGQVRFLSWSAETRLDAEAMKGVEAVVHLAGEPVAQRWSPEVKKHILQSRVEGTRSIVDAIDLAKGAVKVFVCASAVGYYGSRGDETLAESSAPGTGYLPDVCVAWEAEADKATRLGVRVAKLRIAMVLGCEGGALKRMETPFKLGVGGVLASGDQWMPWIHLDDMARLILYALENQQVSGVLNATSPNPVRNRDFTRIYASVLHRPAILPVPAFALRMLYGEMAQIILANQRVVPEAARKFGFVFQFPDLTMALRQIYPKRLCSKTVSAVVT